MKLLKFAALFLILTPVLTLAGEGEKAKIVTGAQKAVQCISPVQVNNIDGREVHVERLGFDIDAGKHSITARAIIDTSLCNVVSKGTERDKIEPIEADFEAGKTYYLGYDHSAPNRRDWKLVIWKVEGNDS
jgi:hypothetical protein